MIVGSDVRKCVVVRGLQLVVQLSCILQVVRGYIMPILSLPTMWCVFRSFDVSEEQL